MTTLTKEQVEHFREPLKRQIRRDTILHIPISDEMKAVDQLIDLALRGLEVTPRPVRKINQTAFGKNGNCLSACIAMLTGKEIAEIPNWSHLGGAGSREAFRDWAKANGFVLLSLVQYQHVPWPPQGFYIASGMSPRGIYHAVIYKDGKLWHDPHPEGGGIDEPIMEAEFLIPLSSLPTGGE